MSRRVPSEPSPVVWATSPEAPPPPAAPWVDALEPVALPLLTLLWRFLGLVALPFLLLIPRARRHILRVPAPEPGWTWLHGASAGEHVAARALVEALGRTGGSARCWRTSSSWRTPVRGAFPAPLDLPFVVERWLDRARPARLILVEAELWPGWIHACRRRGIPVAVVNARPGRGTARVRRVALLWRWLSRGVHFIPQTETGDLKLSASVRESTIRFGRDALVAGSTRPGDEFRVIKAWQLLSEPRPLLVLAPRHVDRIPEIARLLDDSGERYRVRTQTDLFDAPILLLDTMGELASLYRQARAAFVGGTFDSAIGGHSPAEAIAAGLPVVHGPYTHANPGAWSAGVSIRVGTDEPDALARAFRQALTLGRAAPANDASAERAAALLPAGSTPAETPQRPWLVPLAPLWSAAVRRSSTWRTAPVRIDIPVVSVGALVAGGAGRTPVTGWLAARLDGAWIVGRGFRRRRGGEVRVGLPDDWSGSRDEAVSGAGALGDELEMIRRRGHPVVSAPDRVAGAIEAARRGARLVLLDDGFQHRRLHRDLDVVCIDARWPDGRGPIPVGARREPWEALDRAHWLWIHHGDISDGICPSLPRVRSRLRPDGWLDGGARAPLDAVRGEVDVACGIARSEGFVCTLVELGLDVRSIRAMPDHAPLGDLGPGVVVTEKDAARLPRGALVLALLVDLDVDGGDALLDAVRRLIR